MKLNANEIQVITKLLQSGISEREIANAWRVDRANIEIIAERAMVGSIRRDYLNRKALRDRFAKRKGISFFKPLRYNPRYE